MGATTIYMTDSKVDAGGQHETNVAQNEEAKFFCLYFSVCEMHSVGAPNHLGLYVDKRAIALDEVDAWLRHGTVGGFN